jgi:hypothetical protein
LAVAHAAGSIIHNNLNVERALEAAQSRVQSDVNELSGYLR